MKFKKAAGSTQNDGGNHNARSSHFMRVCKKIAACAVSKRKKNMSSTVIIGAGIIGVSTAYYLSDHQPPSTIHLVETAPALFSSASGYAGGFLAKDWFAPTVTSLGALSFELHKKLADEHGGRAKWGYSTASSFGYVPSATSSGQKRGDDWYTLPLLICTMTSSAAYLFISSFITPYIPRTLEVN